jgi:hypothetical protein
MISRKRVVLAGCAVSLAPKASAKAQLRCPRFFGIRFPDWHSSAPPPVRAMRAMDREPTEGPRLLEQVRRAARARQYGYSIKPTGERGLDCSWRVNRGGGTERMIVPAGAVLMM